MYERVLHTIGMRALLMRFAVGDEEDGISGVHGLAIRALLDPATLSDDEAERLAGAMAGSGRGWPGCGHATVDPSGARPNTLPV